MKLNQAGRRGRRVLKKTLGEIRRQTRKHTGLAGRARKKILGVHDKIQRRTSGIGGAGI